MIVTICYDHQTTESAINYLSQEHNRIARVDLNRHHFIHKHGVVLAQDWETFLHSQATFKN